MSLKLYEGFKKRNYVVELKKSFIQEKNKTTCFLDVWFPMDSINKGCFSNKFLKKLEKAFPLLEPDPCGEGLVTQTKGIVTCSDNDAFNEKLGKTLAYSKAQRKAYSIASRLLGLMMDEFSVQAWEALKAKGFMQMCADREKRFIESKL